MLIMCRSPLHVIPSCSFFIADDLFLFAIRNYLFECFFVQCSFAEWSSGWQSEQVEEKEQWNSTQWHKCMKHPGFLHPIKTRTFIRIDIYTTLIEYFAIVIATLNVVVELRHVRLDGCIQIFYFIIPAKGLSEMKKISSNEKVRHNRHLI